MSANDQLFEDLEIGAEKVTGTAGGGKMVFKPSHRGECYLLPPSLDELIGPQNLVRFVDAVVDRLDLSDVIEKYRGGGASAYHPAMLLKIWLFGWCRKVYTSRPLAAALTRDVEFMWLAGEQRPSFMTLADFRRRLNTTIKQIFKDVAGLVMQAGLVRGDELYIDHTKMEANNSRHRVVWRKNAERYLDRANEELEKLLVLIDRLNDEEETRPEAHPKSEALTAELLDELVERVNGRLKEGVIEREQATEEKKQLRQGKERLAARARYQQQLDELDGRNSMGKSDPESSAMLMKDHITVQPGYNLGIAVENGIVVGYDVSNNANDGVSFQAVLDDAANTIGGSPKRVCADAGYGTLENYELLENRRIDSYVKYPGWDRDAKGTRRPYEAESFTYNKHNDRWICPRNTPLHFERIRQQTNPRTGHVSTYREYKAEEAVCTACPVKEECTGAKARGVRVNPEIRRHRENAVKNLTSPMGKRMRSLRSVEAETPFGVSKHAYRFRRYHIRGQAGAAIESGLFFTAFNLRRLYAVFLRYAESGARPALQIAGG